FKYESEYCEKLRSYLEANLGWMEEQMGKGKDPEYWHQAFPRDPFPLAPFGFLLLQLGGDLEDLESKYTLPFRTSAGGSSQIPGSIQVFSSYPGTIFSGDDFYILSSGLVALETTIGNNNPARWKYLDPRSSVLEWLRRFNSGTYNNQWMVVDYNAFVPGRASPPQGLLTVLEQIPYFEEIFNASGNPELVKKYGDWFTYDKNPRAQIFRRNQTLVHDLDSMVRLMRSNNYLRDPLSRCRGCDPPQNAENAISARSDLNPPNGTYPFPALRQRCHGGTDMKVTSSDMAPTFGL
ncbi:PREDICTED: putative phospholipase B-like 2, partial [Tauraco erythrolophus]|uniref:putative phospholipase B-like 2 n=1 Tax=Tauraco erythrolophus TaxID=121530 RepID=UPI000523556D